MAESMNVDGEDSELLESLKLQEQDMVKFKISVFRKLLVDAVIGTHILTGLSTDLPEIFTKEVKQRIRATERTESQSKATDFILDLLTNDDSIEGARKWRAFINILEREDYDYVAKTLEDKTEMDYINLQNQHKIIEVFASDLEKKLIPMQLLPGLLQKRVINEQDKHEIQAEKDTRGDIAATVVLLDRIPRHQENWFCLFLDILLENGYYNIVDQLDECYREKREINKDADYSSSSLPSMGQSLTTKKSSGKILDALSKKHEPMESFDSCVREDTISVSGEGYKAQGLLAPNIPTQSMSGPVSQFGHEVSDILNSVSPVDSLPAFDQEETHNKELMFDSNERTRPRTGFGGLMSLVQNSNETRRQENLSTNNSNLNVISPSYGPNTRLSLGQRSIPETNLPDNCRQSISELSSINDSNFPSFSTSIRSLMDTSILRSDDGVVRNNTTAKELQSNFNRATDDVNNILELHDKEQERNIRGDGAESMIDNNELPCGEDGDQEQRTPKDPLILRSYQQELARPGLEGQNCIIVAPTGSGKTHVALKIIQEHMKQMFTRRHAKVVFLTEQSELAKQQCLQCEKYLIAKVKVITGETQRSENMQELKEWLNRRDILVVTAQLLVNALASGDVKIQQFSLIVFDECHHANLKHAYNKIMHHYIDLKLDKGNNIALPQIVGLTASLGVGKAKNKDKAVEWIETIMAHLDAKELSTVREKTQELREYANVPEQTTEICERRRDQTFGDTIKKLMTSIEDFMLRSNFAQQVPAFATTLRAPSGRGNDTYTQYLSTLWNETAKVYDQEARRFFTTCRNYLEVYNKALIIYEDARVKDALDFLDDKIREINENVIADNTDRKMYAVYQKMKKILDTCMNREDQGNPKLEKLKSMLMDAYEENADSRGIVFVKTRDLVRAIAAWMNEDRDLKCLNAVKFVGAQASVDRGGSTKNEQKDVLQYFKDGTHKVIIATSVAEEGLDIQKCNLVFRYDHVTNEIAMVQSRGRGRAEDSKYVLLAAESGKAARKEELNIMREAMMQNAIIRLQDKIRIQKQIFLENQRKIQLEEKIAREMELRKRKGREVMEGQFELRCGKCQAFICMSGDVKKIQNAHHAVLCSDIMERIAAKKVNKAAFTDQQIQSGVGKITCKKCGMDLGNVSIYRGAQFPIIRIQNFLIVDAYGSSTLVKKWKQAPFIVPELSNEDLYKIINDNVQLIEM